MLNLPETENSLVLRTDYSDDAAWERVREAISAPVGDFRAYVTFVSDPGLRDLTPAEILGRLPRDFQHSFIFVVDDTTLRHAEHPLLVVDLFDERGRTFRVIPTEAWSVENNLSIANMGFDDFAESVDPDGVFRGFP